MKEFRLLSYIKQYQILIVLFSLTMGILFYSYFSGKQTYTASAIIQYRNPEAVQGLAADGTEIDVTEIYSSEVMTRVFEKLGLNYSENNMDAIRANVRVEAAQSKEEETVQEALNEKGEVVEDKPTSYLVSYTVAARDVKDAAGFSKQILNAMLNAYVETYAENHVNKKIPLYSVDGIYDKDYDYIEMVEILDEAVKRALEQLGYKNNTDFRSADTGYSFADLRREFSLLRDIDILNTFSYVLGNQITKDQNILISKYENRIKNAKLKNNGSSAESRGVDEIIEAYVAMMRGSNNTDFTHEYILGEVYENYYDIGESGRQKADQTTEYDALMNHYVAENTEFEETLIDIAYDEYILGVFSGSINEEKGTSVQITETMQQPDSGEEGEAQTEAEEAQTEAAKAGRQQEIISSPESQSAAYEMIKELTDKVDALYQAAMLTDQEYNRFAGAENIAIMTDAITVPELNLFLYAVLASVLFGLVGCVLAIVAGRTVEIFDYYVFTDKKLNVANRAGCDRYIAKFGKVLLPSDFMCISIKMTEIERKNKAFGREKCDQMIADFCNFLKKTLPSEKAFIARNDLAHFVVFLKDSDKEQALAYIRELGVQCAGYNKENTCSITYSCGISSSGKSRIYDIRKLMIDSINKASGAIVRREVS